MRYDRLARPRPVKSALTAACGAPARCPRRGRLGRKRRAPGRGGKPEEGEGAEDGDGGEAGRGGAEGGELGLGAEGGDGGDGGEAGRGGARRGEAGREGRAGTRGRGGRWGRGEAGRGGAEGGEGGERRAARSRREPSLLKAAAGEMRPARTKGGTQKTPQERLGSGDHSGEAPLRIRVYRPGGLRPGARGRGSGCEHRGWCSDGESTVLMRWALGWNPRLPLTPRRPGQLQRPPWTSRETREELTWRSRGPLGAPGESVRLWTAAQGFICFRRGNTAP
nr:glycine-rich cell wall structural protein 1.0-like [Chlorocebus sabaeus]